MPRRRRQGLRFPKQLLQRVDRRDLVIAIVAPLLALLVGAQALGNIVQTRNPGIALKINGDNPVALVTEAQRQWMANPSDAKVRARVTALARASLKEQALNPGALRMLAFGSETSTNVAHTRALLTLAERMNGRDLGTQLWLIEDFVGAGRIDQTLVHYDAALRSNANAGDLLFPILANAISDPNIERGLAPYLRASVPWIVPFVGYATDNGINLPVVARMLVQNGQVAAITLQTRLLSGLIARGDYRAAAMYFRSMPGADARMLQGTAFTGAYIDPNLVPVAWQAQTSGSVSAALESGGAAGRRFHVTMPPEERANALIKYLMLPPGRYALTVDQVIPIRGRGSAINWTVACLNGVAPARPIFEIANSGSRAQGAFTIPADCKAQYLTLNPSSGQGDSGLDLYVDRVALRRLGETQASAPQ